MALEFELIHILSNFSQNSIADQCVLTEIFNKKITEQNNVLSHASKKRKIGQLNQPMFFDAGGVIEDMELIDNNFKKLKVTDARINLIWS